MTEVKDLDVKTLEYVLKVIEEQEEIHEACWKTYNKLEQKSNTRFALGELQADYEVRERINELIREQQESNDS